jgi:hypothetical protein
MLGALPTGWQADHEDLGNEHARRKFSPATPASRRRWRCAYGLAIGPHSEHHLIFYGISISMRVSRARMLGLLSDRSIGMGLVPNFKLLFDRLVCMNGGNPRPNLIETARN